MAGERKGSDHSVDTEALLQYNENVLELTAVIVAQHCAYTKIQYIAHFTVVKIVNFML